METHDWLAITLGLVSGFLGLVNIGLGWLIRLQYAINEGLRTDVHKLRESMHDQKDEMHTLNARIAERYVNQGNFSTFAADIGRRFDSVDNGLIRLGEKLDLKADKP